MANISNVATNIFIWRSSAFPLDKFLETEFLAQRTITYFSVWISIDKLLFRAVGLTHSPLSPPADPDSIPFTMSIQVIVQMFHFCWSHHTWQLACVKCKPTFIGVVGVITLILQFGQLSSLTPGQSQCPSTAVNHRDDRKHGWEQNRQGQEWGSWGQARVWLPKQTLRLWQSRWGKETYRSEAKRPVNGQVYKPAPPGPGTQCCLFCAHAWASLSPGCGRQWAILGLREIGQSLAGGVANLGAEMRVDVDIWD